MKQKENKGRTLTEAEQRRLDRFEQLADDMARQGYVRRDITISTGWANVFAIVLLIPLFLIGYGLFYAIHRSFWLNGFNVLAMLIAMIVLIVVHELIHGASWSLFAPHGFKDIEFGIMWSSLTPYCTCAAPMKKWQHIFGTAMPLILLGIIPMIAGIISGSLSVLLIGILMADSAAGDIMVIYKMLRHRTSAQDVVYMDHPTEAGAVAFERQANAGE